MFIRDLFNRKQAHVYKREIYQLIDARNYPELKRKLGDPAFYRLSRRLIFRIIHLCTNSFDPELRNEITDFLLKNENYLQFARKNLSNFPL